MRTRPSELDASTEAPDAGGIADSADGTPEWTCTIPEAGALADGAYGTPGWTCAIPAQARSIPSCQITFNQYGGCGPTRYHLSCSEERDASSLGCTFGGGGTYVAGDAAPVTSYDYCCFCEGTDAATGCVNVDLSTYDRSCTKDSDCMFIGAGMWCPGGCNCPGGNAAINKNGQACYERTLAQVALTGNCNCPCDCGYEPVCLQGVCTVPHNQ